MYCSDLYLQISNLVLEEEDEDEDGEEEDKKTVEVVDEKEIVVVDEKESVVVEEPAVRVQKRTVLRAGSEGEAVQELQVPFLFLFFGVNYEELYRLIEFICCDFVMNFLCYNRKHYKHWGFTRVKKTWSSLASQVELSVL